MRDLNDFIEIWTEKIKSELLKDFPTQFIDGKEYNVISLPGKPLIKGSQLFGLYEVIDVEGNLVFSSSNMNEVKYVLYSSRNHTNEIKILTSIEELEDAVSDYENHLDNIMLALKDDFKSHFPNSTKGEEVLNKVFRILNLQRY